MTALLSRRLLFVLAIIVGGGFGLCLPTDRDAGCPCNRDRVCRSRRCVQGRCR